MSEVVQIPITTPIDTKNTIPPLDKRLLGIRCISLAVLIAVLIQAIIEKEPIEFGTAYTQWGLIFSIVLFILLVIESFLRRRWIFGFNEIAFETVWCSEIVITLFFWGGTIGLLIAGKGGFNPNFARLIYSIEVHTLPLVLLYLDLRKNKYAFRWKSLPYTYIPYGPYVLTASLLSNLLGATAYPLLDWKDWVSILLCFGIIGLSTFGFFIGNKLAVKSKIVPISNSQ